MAEVITQLVDLEAKNNTNNQMAKFQKLVFAWRGWDSRHYI